MEQDNFFSQKLQKIDQKFLNNNQTSKLNIIQIPQQSLEQTQQNYYNQSYSLYIQNIDLQKQVHQLNQVQNLIEQRNEFLNKIQELQNTNRIYSNISIENKIQQQKRPRKKAKAVERLYKCNFCEKSYGQFCNYRSECSLYQHKKYKHPEQFENQFVAKSNSIDLSNNAQKNSINHYEDSDVQQQDSNLKKSDYDSKQQESDFRLEDIM